MTAKEQSLTLLAVHAHPDDETISTGGVLARAHAEGIHTVLVCATHGEEGEIHRPDLDPEEARPRLGEIREAELRAAAAILGIDEVHFLGYRDSGMVDTPANDNPDNFMHADLDEAAGRLIRIIRRTRPQVIVTYDERGGYGHPDHIKAHRTAVAAFDAAGDKSRFPDAGPPWQPRKLYYTAFPRSKILQFVDVLREHELDSRFSADNFDPASMSVPDEVVTTNIDVMPYVDLKREALRVHATQITSTDVLMTLPEEFWRAGMSVEHFILARSLVPTHKPADDLFAGLRA